MKSTKILIMIVAVMVGVMLSPSQSYGQGGGLSRKAVENAIDKAVKYLFAAQNDQGTWDLPERGEGHMHGHNWGGITALATYALLAAGESYQQEKMISALKFLAKADIHGVYAIGVRCHVWAALPADPFLKLLEKDIYWLLEKASPAGTYHYTGPGTKNGTGSDASVTQYGILGLWEGAKRGAGIPSNMWARVEKTFLDNQNSDGGWSYRLGSGESRGSMTAAGLALLYITQDYLHSDFYRTVGKEHRIQKSMNAALKWFDDYFRADRNPTPHGSHGHTYYYLYGVERIGLASGVKVFNKQDWYEEGAKVLIRSQKANGAIGGSVKDTAFGLLFLVRGGVPVVANKLAIPGYSWNNRPRDVANATRWLADESERQMNWNVLPIDSDPRKWLTSPILYLAGHKKLELTDQQKANLKQYMEMGGLLITSADDSRAEFTRSVKYLAEELFPSWGMKPIEADSPLVNGHFAIKPSTLGLQELNNGVRPIWLHSTKDVSWALHSYDARKDEIFKLIANVYYFMTEKTRVHDKFVSSFITRKAGAKISKNLTVGRLKYKGNWNPEPMAWRVFGNLMANKFGVAIQTQEVDLESVGSSTVPFIHVTGTQKLAFEQAEIDQLKEYVKGGGKLLFEAVSGNVEFSDSINSVVNMAWQGEQQAGLGYDSPIISGEGLKGGYDNSRVVYRLSVLHKMGQINRPNLRAVYIDDEPRVFVSNEDLTIGMLNKPMWGVFGYTRESAQQIMANLILSMAKEGQPEKKEE